MTAQRVLDVINKTLSRDDVTIDTTFEQLGIDSLDTIELLFEIEDEFDVDIPDYAARSIRTVAEVVDGVERLLAGEELPRPPEPDTPDGAPKADDPGAKEAS